MSRKRQRHNNLLHLKIKIRYFYFWILGGRNKEALSSKQSSQIGFNSTKDWNNHWNKRIINNIKKTHISL